MRVFPPEMPNYEKVFTSNKYLGRFKLERVVPPKGFKDIAEYRDTLKDFLIWASFSVWDIAVKMEWLASKFKYDGARRPSSRTTGIQSNTAFSIFTKELIGINSHFVSYSFCVRKLKSYFKELFPTFNKDNPFTDPDKFRYPFQHVTVDFMVMVHQIPERMELLQEAEDKKMNFTTFTDFIINYIGKCNDLEGSDVFQLRRPKNFPLYVKYLK